MAFWIDRLDDEVLPEYDIEQMAEDLDATAQDVSQFYLDTGKAPWLCSEVDLRQLESLRAACEALMLYWKNGAAVDGGSEASDRVRAAVAMNATTERSK
jgi:hypothetical protein